MGMIPQKPYKVKRKNPETGEFEWIIVTPDPVDYKSLPSENSLMCAKHDDFRSNKRQPKKNN